MPDIMPEMRQASVKLRLPRTRPFSKFKANPAISRSRPDPKNLGLTRIGDKNRMSAAIDFLNTIFWGYILIYGLLAVGVFFTLYLGLIQFRHIGHYFSSVFNARAADRAGISPFQALCTSLASRVGTGNLAGVAIAIYLGGPGPYSGCGSSPWSAWRPPMRKACWRSFIKFATLKGNIAAVRPITSRSAWASTGWVSSLRCACC